MEKTNERNSIRRDILETFKVFMIMPHLGQQKIPITDVSNDGLAFIPSPGITFSEGIECELYFYLNLNIRIPLKIKIVHIYEEFSSLKVGCEIMDKNSSAYDAYEKFISLLNSLSHFVDI